MAAADQRLAIDGVLAVGVELAGDLRAPLSTSEGTRLRQLLDEHDLLVFRGQNLTHEQQRAIMSSIGPIPVPEGMCFISTDPSKGSLGAGELAWHSDNSFLQQPYQAISLLATDLVDGASSTRYASNRKVLTALPPALRTRLEDIRITEVYPINKATDRLNEEFFAAMPACTRPAIVPHRNTGAPLLFATLQSAMLIDGIDRATGNGLLQEIFSYLYAPQNTYEHYWHKGDFLIWDNVSLQHARGNVSKCGRRTLQKVVCSELTFSDVYPNVTEDPDYLKWMSAPGGHRDEAAIVDAFTRAAVSKSPVEP